MKRILLFSFAAFLLTTSLSSCVTKKKHKQIESRVQELLTKTAVLESQCLDEKNALQAELDKKNREMQELRNEQLVTSTNLENSRGKVSELQQQLDYFKSTNTDLLARLSDLAVVSKTGAQSIQKSLEALGEQNRYIRDLTSSIQRKDSLNLILVMNLKRALDNIGDEDVNIEVKKGVVYISLSDKLLFKSGSSALNPRAEEVLGKISKIVNDHKELDILVEGHTDNVPIKNNCLSDNWDLSVMRATSVVRHLQSQHKVDPKRMTAGGRSEFTPKGSNETTAGRAENRRTEIIITPKLDQFMQLLTPPN